MRNFSWLNLKWLIRGAKEWLWKWINDEEHDMPIIISTHVKFISEKCSESHAKIMIYKAMTT